MSSSLPSPTPATCPRCGRIIPAGAVLGACPHCLLAAGFASEPAPPGDAPPPTPAEIAPEFPQLDLLELLGRGGMGAVYKARQRSLDRVVALKLLRPGLDADPSFAERFTREARALAQLNHPGIVTLYEFGRTPGGLFFILMEFVDGVNLRQLLAAGRLAPREALAIIPPLCDALQYAHDRGLVHRDIKPENILVDRLGRVKVADFGLAKLAVLPTTEDSTSSKKDASPSAPSRNTFSIDLTEAGKVMGTPRYMAPEQRERPDEVDHRADIYALGVVLYQMLTGELPDAKHLQPPSRRVQLDVRLDEIVLRALEKEPALRYQQASALKTQVESVSAPPSFAAPAVGDSSRPRELTIVAAMFAAVGLYCMGHVAANFPRTFGLEPATLAFPISLGLWRFRPWWRYAALALLAFLVFSLLVSTALILPGHQLQIFQIFHIGIDPSLYDKVTLSQGFLRAYLIALGICLFVWTWRVLRRPRIKALFVAKPAWSRPWLEWTAFGGIWALVLAGNFLLKEPLTNSAAPAPEVASAKQPSSSNNTSTPPPPPASTAGPAREATASIVAPGEYQRAVLQLKLQQAQHTLLQAQSRSDAGIGGEDELATARDAVDLLSAELNGVSPQEIFKLKLQQAQRRLQLAQARANAGVGGSDDLTDAKDKVALLEAELTGDAQKVAQVNLAAAERKLKFAHARHDAGLMTNADMDEAETNAALARLAVKTFAQVHDVSVVHSAGSSIPPVSATEDAAKNARAPATAPSVSSLVTPRLQFRAVLDHEEPDSETLDFATGDRHESLRLSREVLLDEQALSGATTRSGTSADSYGVLLHFTPQGTARFSHITQTLTNHRLAILFDGRILAAPFIHGPIFSDTAVISGRFTQAEVDKLADALRATLAPSQPDTATPRPP